ncbi:MAG TPA: ribonuclease HI family protein [Phycisphaerae bacterium]|nr:ribonuclease HI family protein [Phycisphaerae bacterium]
MKVTIHIDGGARGNPGNAGAGVVLRGADGGTLLEAGYYLGHQTNNVAEYTALLKGLEAAKRAGATELSVFSDSELLVKQINGEYRVRNAALKDLFDDAFARLRSFDKWEVRHVRREQNARADELANLAMDACADVVEVDDV